MLSKQKIEAATYSLIQINYSNIVGHPYCPDDLAKSLFEDGVEAGATWASEQYAPLLSALQEFVYANYSVEEAPVKYQNVLIELNKLKQP